MTGGIGCRAVHLRGVLSREGTAAVSALATIGIHDDLTARETCITVRTADDELARGVHIILDVQPKQIEHLLRMDLLLHTGDEDIDDVVLDAGQHLLVLVELVVLGRDDDGVDALRDAGVAVLDSHLTLGIRTQIGHLLTLLADVGQSAHDEVCQVERDGHKVLRLVGGITEHHTLIAGSLLFLVAVIDTTVDVGALLMDGTEDTTRVAVELVFSLRIADAFDGVAGDGLQIDIHLAAHLTHDHYLSCGDKRLDGTTGLVVVS